MKRYMNLARNFHQWASLQRAFHALRASILPSEDTVEIVWSDGVQTQHNATWLRHNCTCPSCVQAHSGQRTLQSCNLKMIHKINDLQLEDGCVRTTSEDHVSFTPVSRLRQPELSASPCSIAPGRHEFQKVITNEQACFSWLKDIGYHGYAIVCQANSDNDAIMELANQISRPQPTIYGTTFDVVATPKPINIAYSTAPLELHQDLVYYESPPGLQFLHAMHFDDSVTGGESVLLDALSLADRFKQTHPSEFEILTRIPMRFQKIHYDRELPVHMTSMKPIIQTNDDGTVVEVTWSPPFEGPLLTKHPAHEVADFYDAYIAFAQSIQEWKDLHIVHRLFSGDILTFNNRRMLHGRQAFSPNGGRRHLRGIYVNINEFASRLNVFCVKNGIAPPDRYGDGQLNVL